MIENRSKIELVAPAGGPGQLTAALNTGADSIYLGFKQYGARAYAENFDFKQIRKAVDRAHGRGVKIYLTLNTIIKNDEIPDIIYFLNNYLDICNDGIIIQDMGLCRILVELFPGVPIHASTQMNIHNSSSLDFFGSAGIRRAVLAREMTLKEIKSLSNTAKVDLEIFGHGSQCFCYSGSCYLSSFTGGRSGNRGRCSQPCRMKYSLIGSGGARTEYLSDSPSYLLSKNDLYTLDILPEIIRAGIKALKIEGRMKSPEYVAIIVKTYRKYIDLYYRDPENYKVSEEDIYKIKQIFSRGLCSGYYKNNFAENIIDTGKSGSIGNFIGRIKKIDYSRSKREDKGYGEAIAVYINSKWPVLKGDILEIWTRRGNKRITIKDIGQIEEKGEHYYRIGLDNEKGLSLKDRVFKYFDKKIDEEAKSLFRYINSSDGKDDDKYYSGKISGLNSGGKLKQYLERYHIDKITEKRIDTESVGNGSIRLTVKIYNLRELENILSTDADNIILASTGELLDGKMRKDKVLQGLVEKNRYGKQLIIDTPDIIYDRDMDKLKPEIDSLIKCGVKHFRVSNPGVLELLRQHDNMKKSNGIMVRIGNIFNISNILALDFYKNMIEDDPGLSGFELSPEINTDEIRSIIDSFKKIYKNGERYIFSVFAHGFFRVMAARYETPYYKKASGNSKTGLFLEDRKKYKFRITEDKNGNTLIYNSKNICTVFDLDKMISSGINDLVIDSLFTRPEDIKKILKKYREAISIYCGSGADKYSLFLKDLSRDPLFRDYSKGHLSRGVE